MTAKNKEKKISDEAVQKRTGKNWQQWFELIDNTGGTKMSHKELVEFIYKNHLPNDGWYAQMITVAYEQERGMRELHQKPDGYEISVSKTIAIPLPDLWQYFEDEGKRNNWLSDIPIIIHKATPHKSMRITWTDGQKSISVNFYDKGGSKSQVVVQHMKLPDANASEEKKVFWADKLELLKNHCEN